MRKSLIIRRYRNIHEWRTNPLHLTADKGYSMGKYHIGLCTEYANRYFPELRGSEEARITLKTWREGCKKQRRFRLPAGSNCIEVYDMHGRYRSRVQLMGRAHLAVQQWFGMDYFTVDVEALG